jgi:hypothetical protein
MKETTVYAGKRHCERKVAGFPAPPSARVVAGPEVKIAAMTASPGA